MSDLLNTNNNNNNNSERRFSTNEPIPNSPLKQLNSNNQSELNNLETKLNSTWNELTSNSNLFLNQNHLIISRFFNELFCLKVKNINHLEIIQDCLNKLTLKDLLGIYKNNMTQLFTHSIKLLKESEKGDIKISNIIETLIVFLKNVLAPNRKYSNFSFEVMNLLAGSLERSDSVFTDLVCAIDVILQDSTAPVPLRSRTLYLSIILVASINQASLNAYFLRRDLFSTLIRLISDPTSTTSDSFFATLLLGLLSNFRKLDARNPYLARIEDFVDDFVMKIIVDVVKTSVKDGVTKGYAASGGVLGNGILSEDGKSGFVAGLTSLVYGSIELLRGGFSLSLPPPVVSKSSNKGKEKAISQNEGGEEKEKEGGEKSNSTSSSELNEKMVEGMSQLGLDLPPVVPSKVGIESPLPSTVKIKLKEEKEKKEEHAFKSMPPEATVILLPFYDLLNSNKAFCTTVYADTETGPAELPTALISLSSYLFCHASVSLRSRVYSRLCLIILTILVEEGEGRLTVEAEEIKLCRQRLPMLPQNQGRRPPIAAVLDTTLIFLRHNMHKRLDVESYVICLKLVQRMMQQLKNERIRLEYDWVALWRSILSLSAFIVSKVQDLRIVSTQLDDLISQIFIVLSYAAYWGETFFATNQASVLLHYELLHSEQTLLALSTLLDPPPTSSTTTSTTSTNLNSKSKKQPLLSPLLSPSPNIPRRLSVNVNQFYYSSATTGTSSTTFQATECITNLKAGIDFFTTELTLEKQSKFGLNKPGTEAAGGGEELEVEVVMKVIERGLNRLELSECVAMGDMRKEELGMSQGYFQDLANVACQDAIALVN